MGTIDYLFLVTLIFEAVDVDVATRLFCSVVEDSELCAHEEPAIIKNHPIVFRSDLNPLFAVDTVEEVCHLSSTIFLAFWH